MTDLEKLAKEALSSNDVCDKWQKRILEAAPHLRERLEINKWYRIDRTSTYNDMDRFSEVPAYIRYTGPRGCHGWDHAGNWTNNYYALPVIDFGYDVSIVEQKKLNTLFYQERFRRGLTAGARIKDLLGVNIGNGGDDRLKITNEEARLYPDTDALFIDNIMLYKNGVWAVKEEIQTITLAEAEKKLGMVITLG